MNDFSQLQVRFVSGRFPKIRRCPESSALRPIPLGVGGRNDEDRRPGTSLALTDVREYVHTAHFRKIQVEKEQLRTAGIGVGINARDKSDGLLAIFHQVKFNVQLAGGDRLFNQEHVGRVVLNQYDWGRWLNSGR